MRSTVLWLSMLNLTFNAYAAEVSDTLHTQQLNELIVTGSNSTVGRNMLPYAVSTISGTQLEATGSSQLLSAVSGMVPSLFVTERNILGFGVSNGGAGHIKMRGVGGDRASGVLMMVDGQPQFAGLYSHHVADFYSTESVERVEVLRGPASVLYGSNAMAGVINVITKYPHKQGSHTTLSSQFGSYNTSQTSLTNTSRFGNFSVLASAGYNRTDGVEKEFDFSQANAYAKIGYDFSEKWSVKTDYSFMSFSGNDPIYPSLKGQSGVYHQKVIRGEASLTAQNSYKVSNGAARIYYSYGNHFIHDPNYFHSLDDRFGILIYQNFAPWRGTTATVGFDFDRYTGKIPVSGGKDHIEAPLATLERKAITEYSPYVTLQQNIWAERIIINAGLRMANSSLFNTQWVPQAGFVFRPWENWTIKCSVAKGYRNPSFRELYLYKFANSELQPESMMNYEASVGWRFNRYLAIDLTGYFARGSNMIQQTAILNENTGRFFNKGLELSLQSHPLDKLTLWGSYSFLHTSITDLTGAPKHQYYLGLGWDAFTKFHIDAELKGVSGLYVAEDVDIQSFATLNLRLTYQPLRQFQVFVNLDNITDTHYVINKGYPMPGITVMGGFKVTI